MDKGFWFNGRIYTYGYLFGRVKLLFTGLIRVLTVMGFLTLGVITVLQGAIMMTPPVNMEPIESMHDRKAVAAEKAAAVEETMRLVKAIEVEEKLDLQLEAVRIESEQAKLTAEPIEEPVVLPSRLPEGFKFCIPGQCGEMQWGWCLRLPDDKLYYSAYRSIGVRKKSYIHDNRTIISLRPCKNCPQLSLEQIKQDALRTAWTLQAFVDEQLAIVNDINPNKE